MSNQIETVTQSPADVVRGLYDALGKGDVPGVLAKLAPEVIIDEPTQLPYGGVHQGREVFVQSILDAMMGYANVAITDAEVFEGPRSAACPCGSADSPGAALRPAPTHDRSCGNPRGQPPGPSSATAAAGELQSREPLNLALQGGRHVGQRRDDQADVPPLPSS
ncbi:nuclear transport factor 2 family protein [Streptomyces chartreusis]